MEFFVKAGVAYQIAVDGFDSGSIVLNLYPTTGHRPQIIQPPQSQSAIVGSTVFFDVEAGGTAPLFYQWRRNGSNLAGANDSSYGISNVQSTNGGSYTVVVTNAAGSITSVIATLTIIVPPANDNFSGRILLTGATNNVTASNVAASTEIGEPYHAGEPGGSSVWWTWTAPRNGVVTLDTIGSNFDTLLAVYTGTSVTALVGVASDDESGGNSTSRLTFSAISGTRYQIAVDGYFGGTGTISLHLREP